MASLVIQDGQNRVTFAKADNLGLQLRIKVGSQRLVVNARWRDESDLASVQTAVQNLGQPGYSSVLPDWQCELLAEGINGLVLSAPVAQAVLATTKVVVGMKTPSAAMGPAPVNLVVKIVPTLNSNPSTVTPVVENPSDAVFELEVPAQRKTLENLAKKLVAWSNPT